MKIERWGSGVKGRNYTVACNNTVWTVSNAKNLSGNFAAQVHETLGFLDTFLNEAGTSRDCLVSVQVILANIGDRDQFNEIWCEWVGNNPENWPQRAVFAATLAPGLLLEVIATAVRS